MLQVMEVSEDCMGAHDEFQTALHIIVVDGRWQTPATVSLNFNHRRPQH
jgi:hypothetical protein